MTRLSRPRVQTDKVDLQLADDDRSMSGYEQLKGTWLFNRARTSSMGSASITRRDPDGLLIAIYEGEI